MPIQEIWRWNPPSVAQFTDTPATPTAAVEWTSWNRTNASSILQRLTGDSAYLVRVGTNVPGAPSGTTATTGASKAGPSPRAMTGPFPA